MFVDNIYDIVNDMFGLTWLSGGLVRLNVVAVEFSLHSKLHKFHTSFFGGVWIGFFFLCSKMTSGASLV